MNGAIGAAASVGSGRAWPIINNPLNIISGYAELTMKRLESADFR